MDSLLSDRDKSPQALKDKIANRKKQKAIALEKSGISHEEAHAKVTLACVTKRWTSRRL
jgi:hypothetical protein